MVESQQKKGKKKKRRGPRAIILQGGGELNKIFKKRSYDRPRVSFYEDENNNNGTARGNSFDQNINTKELFENIFEKRRKKVKVIDCETNQEIDTMLVLSKENQEYLLYISQDLPFVLVVGTSRASSTFQHQCSGRMA